MTRVRPLSHPRSAFPRTFPRENPLYPIGGERRLAARQDKGTHGGPRQGQSPAALAAGFAEEHYDAVFRYCARRLPTPEDAQDATQEVFLRLVRSGALYESRGKPLAYLYTCARNVCADFHRRPQAALEPLGADAERVRDPAQERHEERLAVRDALSRLAPEEQEVLELRYGQDLPMADISAVTGKSRFALHRMERRALGELKRMMGGD